jgi:predicted KAP-like P-loop ATPase
MGFQEEADNIGNLLATINPPLANIGIFGGYGSGKTTFLKAISRALPHTEGSNIPVLKIGFEASRYEDEHLILSLLSVLCQHLPRKRDKNVLKNIRRILSSILHSVSLEAGVGKAARIALSIDKASHYYSRLSQKKVDKILDGYVDIYDNLRRIPLHENGNVKYKIVVFIDDLDRCLPAQAFALLEAIRAFMDIPGFMFVVALDPRAVDTYLSTKYGENFIVDCEEYLQKMFQVAYTLPLPTYENIKEELGKILLSGGVPKTDWAEKIWKIIDTDSFEDYLPRNLRLTKRILNAHQMYMFSSEDLGLCQDLFALLLLQTLWPKVYWALLKFPDVFRTTVGVLDDKAKIPDKIEPYGSVIKTMKDPECNRFLKNCIVGQDGIFRLIEEQHRRGVPLGWPVGIDRQMEKEKWKAGNKMR